MKLLHATASLKTWREKTRKNGDSIGLVMTMGHLHVGHVSLIQRSLAENAMTIVSVFVNPTQFNNADDYRQYPRTYEADCELCRQLGVDAIFAPEYNALYPDDYHYRVLETTLSEKMEGRHRPGHFSGMLTVVLKVLLLSQPTRAYFSEKDYQQLALIQEMAAAFFLDVDIVACPFIRDEFGLPLSSRNTQLSAEELQLARSAIACLHQATELEDTICSLEKIGVVVDYVTDYEGRRFAAFRVGTVRLIDNVSISSLEPVRC